MVWRCLTHQQNALLDLQLAEQFNKLFGGVCELRVAGMRIRYSTCVVLALFSRLYNTITSHFAPFACHDEEEGRRRYQTKLTAGTKEGNFFTPIIILTFIHTFRSFVCTFVLASSSSSSSSSSSCQEYGYDTSSPRRCSSPLPSPIAFTRHPFIRAYTRVERENYITL